MLYREDPGSRTTPGSGSFFSCNQVTICYNVLKLDKTNLKTFLDKREDEIQMAVTIVAILMIMLGYFLILYGVVAFIQDKRFFSSAPKENLEAIPDKKQRFPGASIVGWIIEVIALALFAGAVILAAWDGVKNNFGFGLFFARFIAMLYCMEIYDICFFDWALLCHSNFFPHFYPELKGVVGPHMFGYNKKTHIMHFIIYIPICLVVAWVCTLF